eukprot:5286541-Amphidinium_carterae.1
MGGVNLCDKRRPLTDIRRDFPHVDFSLFKDEEDPNWSDEKREDPKNVSDRCYDFCLWLKERPETEVVVATHSAWLFTLFNTVLECSTPELTDWFLTGAGLIASSVQSAALSEGQNRLSPPHKVNGPYADLDSNSC